MKRSQHKKTHPQRQQWQWRVKVAETPPAAVVEVAETPPAAQAPTDPAVVLESALADVEELLGEKLNLTRELLQDSDRKARDAVTLATSALELLTVKTKQAAHVSEHDLPLVLRAQKSASQLVLWRNFGLMRGLVEKLDPEHFRRYDEKVQTELKQTYCKIEQMLMQELIAGDSWSKLARNLRLQSDQKDFSAEMRTLLHRIIQTCELIPRHAKKRRGPEEALSEADKALFEEMSGDDRFNSQVMFAVHNNRLQQQHERLHRVHQMLGWQLAASSSDMMHQMPVNHWAEPEPWSPEPWPPGLLPWHSTASSSSGAQ